MPLTRGQRGAAVEAAALEHLRRAGLQLLARNVRFKGGELDLVMRDGSTVVFVEVRYRASQQFGGGAASVDWRKQQKLVLAAQLFLQRQPALAQQRCRFDVVDATGDPLRLTWLRDAFRLEDC